MSMRGPSVQNGQILLQESGAYGGTWADWQNAPRPSSSTLSVKGPSIDFSGFFVLLIELIPSHSWFEIMKLQRGTFAILNNYQHVCRLRVT